MKIGILTFSFSINYGAVLQAYGLKQTLSLMGHEVHVIDYRPRPLLWDRRFRRPGFRSLMNRKGIFIWLGFFHSLIKRPLKIKKFDTFAREYLNQDATSPFDLKTSYDAIVCGSDQIWNPAITGGKLEDAYWGRLPEGKTRKTIAYAASVGDVRNLDGYDAQLTERLKYFSAISCREASLTDYVNRLCPEADAVTVLDPTLLAGRDVFSKISSPRLCQEPYLLYFDLFDDNSIRQRAIALAEEKGLKFIEVATCHEFVKGKKIIASASPDEFCSWVRHADFVITTSFHGTAFSIIFQREFLSLEFMEKTNDRILNLLALTGLDDHFVHRDAPLPQLAAVNWNEVDRRLSVERERSMEFLCKSLER